MIDFESWTDGEGASHSLVGELTAALADERTEPVHQGDDFAIYRDGTTVSWRDMGSRPHRRRGATALTDPASFGEYVSRLATAETVLYADRRAERVVAVFNDHPASTAEQPVPAVDTAAGYCDHTAELILSTHEDWSRWVQFNGQLRSQRDFGEFVEEMAHTIVRPDAATMLEVATSLTMTRSLDFGSRVRLDNGDVEFRFVEESNARAGRQSSIEIPQTFDFMCPVWEGGSKVNVEARLRVRGDADGVRMGYKLIRLSDAVDIAFDDVAMLVGNEAPGHVPTFLGSPPPSLR